MTKKKTITQVNRRNNDIVNQSGTNNVIPYLFNIDKITKKNCKLCQSEHREFVENFYDNQRRKNYTEIRNKLKETYDFDISLNAIRNHIIYHYLKPQKNETLQEYANGIQEWVDMQTNKVSSIRSRIAVMEKEMFAIAQTSEDISLTARRKNADTIKKLAETILVYEDKLKEYKEGAKPVNLIFNQLQVIVQDEMEHVNSTGAKKVLGTVLTRLKESIGDIIVD